MSNWITVLGRRLAYTEGPNPSAKIANVAEPSMAQIVSLVYAEGPTRRTQTLRSLYEEGPHRSFVVYFSSQTNQLYAKGPISGMR